MKWKCFVCPTTYLHFLHPFFNKKSNIICEIQDFVFPAFLSHLALVNGVLFCLLIYRVLSHIHFLILRWNSFVAGVNYSAYNIICIVFLPLLYFCLNSFCTYWESKTCAMENGLLLSVAAMSFLRMLLVPFLYLQYTERALAFATEVNVTQKTRIDGCAVCGEYKYVNFIFKQNIQIDSRKGHFHIS